jgi:hypothetical protein
MLTWAFSLWSQPEVIVWMVVAYNAAQASGDSRVLYDLGRGVRDLGIPIVAIAFLLAVPGLLTANPTTVRQEAAAQKAGAVRGVLRINLGRVARGRKWR